MSATRQELSKLPSSNAQSTSTRDQARSTTGGKTPSSLLTLKREKQECQEDVSPEKCAKEKVSGSVRKPGFTPAKGIEKKSEKKRKEKGEKKRRAKSDTAQRRTSVPPPQSASNKLFSNLAHKNVRKLVRQLDPTDERAIAVLIQCYDILNYRHEEAERMRVIRYIETFKPIKAPKPKTPKSSNKTEADQAMDTLDVVPSETKAYDDLVVEEKTKENELFMARMKMIQQAMVDASKETLRELFSEQSKDATSVHQNADVSQGYESESEMESDETYNHEESAAEGVYERNGAEDAPQEEGGSERDLESTHEIEVFDESELNKREED